MYTSILIFSASPGSPSTSRKIREYILHRVLSYTRKFGEPGPDPCPVSFQHATITLVKRHLDYVEGLSIFFTWRHESPESEKNMPQENVDRVIDLQGAKREVTSNLSDEGVL